MSLTLREIKLLKQRTKKSGPPCGVDFKRELTSSVLTSRGFHCMNFNRIWKMTRLSFKKLRWLCFILSSLRYDSFFSVVEAFFLNEKKQYLEVELSP